MEQIKEKIKEIAELIANKIIEGEASNVTYRDGWYNLEIVIETNLYWSDQIRIEISVNPGLNQLQSHNSLIQSKYFEPYKEKLIKAALDKYTKKRIKQLEIELRELTDN